MKPVSPPSPGSASPVSPGEPLPRNPFVLSSLLDRNFFERHWTRELAHFSGQPERFAGIFGWAELNTMLQTHHKVLMPPYLKLVRNGEELPVESFTDNIGDRRYSPFRQVSSHKLRALCADGCTLILNGVDRLSPTLQVLASDLAAFMGERVQINLYYSQQPTQGFEVHYDTHDVIVVQVEGSKQWMIGEITHPYPLRTQPSKDREPPPGPFRELTLRRGDVLYIPRGMWHYAVARDEPSMHLSVGVNCRTRHDFLTWLVSTAVEDPVLRQNLPHPRAGSKDLTPAELQIMREAVGRLLADPAILDRYDAYWATQHEGPVVRFDFPG